MGAWVGVPLVLQSFLMSVNRIRIIIILRDIHPYYPSQAYKLWSDRRTISEQASSMHVPVWRFLWLPSQCHVTQTCIKLELASGCVFGTILADTWSSCLFFPCLQCSTLPFTLFISCHFFTYFPIDNAVLKTKKVHKVICVRFSGFY